MMDPLNEILIIKQEAARDGIGNSHVTRALKLSEMMHKKISDATDRLSATAERALAKMGAEKPL